MKISYPVNSSGERVEFITPEYYVYSSTGKCLTDKIAEINTDVTNSNTSITAINKRITNIQSKIPTTTPIVYGLKKRTGTGNICILTDNNGTITSDYGFTYEKLAQLLSTGSFSDYIKNGDWIKLTTSDGATYTMYANIDTYYGLTSDFMGVSVPHHIDFISKELIKGSIGWIYHTNNNASSNNGVSGESSPFLAATSSFKGASSFLVMDNLKTYYNSYIPARLKGYIVKKLQNVPYRYKLSETQSDDNGSGLRYMHYLWLPYEKEISGSNYYATAKYETPMVQYHSFSSITDFKIKCETGTTTTSPWWTASAATGSSNTFVRVYTTGKIDSSYPNSTSMGCPLCFRFQ